MRVDIYTLWIFIPDALLITLIASSKAEPEYILANFSSPE